MSDTLIHMQNVTKSYGGRVVVQIDELKLARQSHVFLWGENASGKSSLLQLLFGLSRPSSGTCTFSADFKRQCRLLLPQHDGLYPDLSMRQNLIILAGLYDRQPVHDPIEELLGYDAAVVMDAPLRTLSGGMRRVATVACLLSLRPDYLFLDEPFDGLDPGRRARVTSALERRAPQIDLLLVTGHSQTEAAETWRDIHISAGKLEHVA